MPISPLSPNPPTDLEWSGGQVRWEEKNTVESERRWAGGKGVNVARWLRYLGGDPRLVLPLGGSTGRELAACLRGERLRARIIPLQQPTRVNVIVTTGGSGQLRFNRKGPRLGNSDWNSVLSAVRQQLSHSKALVLSGGLPLGLRENAYARLLKLAHDAGLPSFLDCDGAGLAASVKARPFLVKPNVPEL